MTVLNVKNFQFKNTQLTFPICVFISLKNYQKQIKTYYWVFFIGLSFTLLIQFKQNPFSILIYAIMLIGYGIYLLRIKKPKLVLYPDKIVLTNHGLTKPKIFAWQDCIFEIEKTKGSINKTDTVLLYLISKNDQGQKHRFCVLNLNAIRFNDKQFGVDEHLAIFQKIKNGEFQK